jgi:acetate kinase
VSTAVLVVNAGSSSLKLTVLGEGDERLAAETVPATAGAVDQGALVTFLERAGPVRAVGHRVVHGGTVFSEPVLVDEGVRRKLAELADLAPLHQPKSLAALDSVSRLLPGVPAVACFDTAFHATIPPEAHTYALPQQWRRRWELRRFGFHGLSHAYCSRRTAEFAAPLPAEGASFRVVSCHLGAGASLAAVKGGVSVDTTMGFTPLEGLVMATRSGNVDPGLVLWLAERAGIPTAELASTLENRSGLFGLAGTADMRRALEAEAAGDPAATLALGVYLHRLRAGIAAMAAALGGLDAISFTGGVGEGSAEVRRRAAEGLSFLGIEVDPAANEERPGARALRPDRELTAPGARVRAFVIEAREDLEIARGVRSVLGL